MHQRDFQILDILHRLHMERVQPLTERQPSRACHQPIDDVAVYAISGERNRFIHLIQEQRIAAVETLENVLL